ncbi:ATP-binding cassette sub-family C member 5-like isoform X1 [Dreissena polymorpha]|uniref:ATP-binding cassette sub-family C member 5-like isoform X1 n=1 Tax=Dreissena polymorpha TaxID=45954 RepID=UPI00226468FE|nr:ATP-binding cassette sub-family C member 5-like isoform X1 [Dreissena polymorpha]XP_052214650.1 ATP-binding cassette sub-family C member 5-like isoform X1 [Dreissena polymorpha]XP_052214651.1 ATP-binding cassette sub-family C member 5-like isoform X1 [Dreissena polymorpha]
MASHNTSTSETKNLLDTSHDTSHDMSHDISGDLDDSEVDKTAMETDLDKLHKKKHDKVGDHDKGDKSHVEHDTKDDVETEEEEMESDVEKDEKYGSLELDFCEIDKDESAAGLIIPDAAIDRRRDGDIDDRVDDLTRSLLGLEGGVEVTPMSASRRGFRKYNEALKGALPIRFKKSAAEEIPSSTAGFLSLMTFSWQTSMMWNIYRKGIEHVQHMRIGPREQSHTNSERLRRLWQQELSRRGPKNASFIRVVLLFIRTRFLIASVFILLTVAAQFSVPAFILHRLLSHLNSGNLDTKLGIGLVVALGAMELGRALFFALAWYYNYTTGVRVRGATMGLLYQKVLRLRNLGDKTVGELVNLLNNDAQRIFDAVVIGPLMLPGPLVLLAGLIYMLWLIGPWAFVTVGTFVAFYPFMFLVSHLTNYYRRRCIVITDKRVRMMNELLTCIKLIKMYAWEKSFAKTISAIRAEERRFLEKGAYVQSISTATAPIVPVMASIFTFLAYVLTGNELTPVIAFTIISVLNSMRFTLGVLPFAVKSVADAKVSFKRYKDILLMDEMEPHRWQVFNDRYAVVMNHATYRWDKEPVKNSDKNGKGKQNGQCKPFRPGQEENERLHSTDTGNGDVTFVDTPTLRDITFNIEKGKLVGICGSVGCGKSSLLSALLGRLINVSGKTAIQGSTAYVSQQAWIMNTSVRENILFGEEYDEHRYASVVEACCLVEDFGDFVDGDMTEIGERGINLSGGQKQRVSLARAVYSNKAVYLLDDPLSAVDIHIGRHIFSQCIRKLLKGKTVLFVTHQLQYLSECDNVMFMRDGMIVHAGTHQQLMAEDTDYSALIKMFYSQDKKKGGSQESLEGRPKSIHKQFSVDRPDLMRQRTLSSGSRGEPPQTHRQTSVMSSRTMSVEEEKKEQSGGGKLIVAEEKHQGRVGLPMYRAYLKAAGGYMVTFLTLLLFLVAIATQSFANWWLSHWLNQGSGNTTVTDGNLTYVSRSISDNPNLHFYTSIYGASIGAMIITTAIRAFIFMKVTLRASSNMHNLIFKKMMASPMKFFDTTPVGRIINRFSSDLDEVDVRLPSASEMLIQNMFLITFSLVIIAVVLPWFLIALVPLVGFFLVLNAVFTSGVRELMRMNLITKSPVVSHVTASIQGITTIHAFNKTQQFIEKFQELIDKNSCYFHLFNCSNRWLAFRLDLISGSVVAFSGLCVILSYEHITPAQAGLAMSFAIQMTGLFQFSVRQAIDCEAKFVAVQRLMTYSKDVESEAPAVIKDKRPPADWPKPGEIIFDKYKMRYRDNLPLALKGLSFKIRAKDKVGIVGRSGSGKSSLGVALFRLVEPDSGTIYIDNINIATIGLEDLRSRLAIIPQDPVLFVGTVRYNLDPFGLHKDSDLWEALEKCHVKDTILSLELKLDHMVVENGENFSVGERQLICMARALLRNSKILMLDEATAAIDTETDSLVQQTIKDTFSECTMLIIAHRLNTVLGCDKILVMEDGKVAEYGRPKDLLQSKTSKFKTMMEAADKQGESVVS